LSTSSRFLAKCGPADEHGCIPWIGHKLPTGYGMLRSKRGDSWTKEYAHRIAWSLKNGEVPSGKCVLHRCDNPSCVNVEHLFLGTQADNMRNKASKGRHHMRTGGLVNGLNAIDDERIRDLDRMDITRDGIADWLGISQATVSHVLSGALSHSAHA
jgi:hypothetical protein